MKDTIDSLYLPLDEHLLMTKLDLTHEVLQKKIDQLNAQNKRLRLRPSLHSTEANIFDFMNMKSAMAEAMLKATTVQQAFEISILFLTKITNIHSIVFFQREKEAQPITIPGQKSCPKKLLIELSDQENNIKLSTYLFPEKNTYFYSKSNIKENEPAPFDKYLKIYQTRVITPIIIDKSTQISVLLLSKKEFNHSQYFKIIIENIQAQLKSSFSRIIYQEQLLNQAEHIEESIKKRVEDYQKMNKELISQIHQVKKEIMGLNESLNLYQGIVEKQKDIILRTNKEGSILYHNPAFLSLNFLGGIDKNNLLCYFGDGDFPGIDQIIHDFEEGIQQINCEILVQLDTPTWFNFFFTPIKNKRGLIIEIQVSARNIDVIKSLEAKLITQNNMAISMLNNSNNIHFTINKKGEFVFLSDNWTKILGLRINEGLNKSIFSLISKSDSKTINEDVQSILSKNQEKCSRNISLEDIQGKNHTFKLKLTPFSTNKLKIDFISGVLIPLISNTQITHFSSK